MGKSFLKFANPAAAVSSSIQGISKAFEVPSIKLPKDINVDEAAALAADRERRRRAGLGRGVNILTGPQGLLSPADIGRKTLLGE